MPEPGVAMSEPRDERESMLTWRPGPPTEPGLYVCEYSDDKPFYLVDQWPLDYGPIPVIQVRVIQHILLPQPPTREGG